MNPPPVASATIPAGRLLEAVRDGRPALQGIISTPSVLVAEVIARTGYDGIWLDLQHGSMDIADLYPLIAVLEAHNVTATVRVPSANDVPAIWRALDAGAGMIVCPDVRTAETAKALAAACRYPPVGDRGMGQSRLLLEATITGQEYSPARENERVMVVAQIESPEGLENVDAIVGTPGIDGIFPGLVDYSLLAHGELLPGMNFLDPMVRAPLERIVEATHAAGKLVGWPVNSADDIRQTLELGANWIVFGSEVGWLLGGARTAIAAWHRATGTPSSSSI